MTVEEARKEIGSIDDLCRAFCDYCTSNDWYCPSLCPELEKAKEIGIERLTKCYAAHDGDLAKVMRYIKTTKLTRKKGGY